MTKHRRSRREFMGIAGAGIASLVGAPWLGAAPAAQAQGAGLRPQDADLVVFNAKVYTVDSRAPRAEAFAVKAGRFSAVGTGAEIRALTGKGTQTFDARQMTVVPGFIDCHNHAPGNVLLYEVLVGNPYEVEFVTISSIVEKLRAKALKTPPATWVEGFFFDDTKVKDNRQLNIHDLDQVSTDLPVAVHHRGGHTSFYNSKAFELANITKDTPNPPGGTFDRDSSGSLNGRVTDLARAALDKVGKRPTFTEEQTMQRDRDALAYISKQFVRYGVTTVHHEGGNLAALQQVRARGELLHRVSYEASGKVLDAMIASGIERAQRLFPRADARPKITHCTLINDDLIRRIKAGGVVPAAFTSYAYYNSDKFVFYGEELMKRCMAYRSFLDAGIPVAAGSDFSPGPFDPRMAIQGMVTRTGWDGKTWGANQRITVEEALRVNTLNGAYNSHEEAIKGSITPGKLADFVVLSDDPFTMDQAKIKDLQIVRTVVAGSPVYHA